MIEVKPYIPKRFPRWIETPDGNRMIVKDCKTMSAMMGEEYDENADLVVNSPVVAPAHGPAPATPAAHAQTVEELLADMAKQSKQAHEIPNALVELDPMGIFATPEPGDVSADKKRRKTAKE